MTAYTDFDNFLLRAGAPFQQVHDLRNSITALSGRSFSSWLVSGSTLGAGSAPGAAVVPSRTAAGAIGQVDAFSEMRVARAKVNRNAPAMLVLCDRLSHQSGLSGTVTTAQTTNLPTAALTRYTSGDGVFAALEIYTAIGGTQTTYTVSYTNQAGTSGRASELSEIGGANFSTASRFLPIPLQKGDSGVRAVANVDLTASTTTAGNFGVTLYKPLLYLPFVNFANGMIEFDGMTNLGGQLPQVLAGACLFWVMIPGGTFGGQANVELVMTDSPPA